VTRGRIGVGLVGAGAFGRRLGRAVRRSADLELVALVDPSREAAVAASAELEVAGLRSLEELLGRPDVHAVIVATPHATHAPIALAAFAAGRHAFVEKPLTIGVHEARAVIAAASAAGRVLLVGHVTRLLPLVTAALAHLDAGDVGEPRAGWFVRHQPLRRTGWMARRTEFGMLLHSPAVHNVDLMDRILGRPVQVTALAAPPIQDGLDYPDVVAVLVGFAGGAIGSLGATVSDPLHAPWGTSSARIVGSRGGLAFDIAAGTLDLQREGGTPERRRIEAEGWGLDAAIDAELRSFAAAIRGTAAPFVAPQDALLAVAVCEAADRSIATGLPVDLGPLLDGNVP
jgi:predicted dehydrogenase